MSVALLLGVHCAFKVWRLKHVGITWQSLVGTFQCKYDRTTYLVLLFGSVCVSLLLVFTASESRCEYTEGVKACVSWIQTN